MNATQDITITPFRVDIPQADVDDLASRLRATRMPAPLPGDDWDTGIPSGYLHELVSAWAEDFDWRAFEARLNEVPQFTTVIDGQRIHFAHVRSVVPNATPVLLTHGWPDRSSSSCTLSVRSPTRSPTAETGQMPCI